MMQRSLFQSPTRDPAVRVGPAGWNYKDWIGVVYPARLGKSLEQLSFLADYFDTIEINSSFYRPPRPADARAWAGRVRKNPRFKFTAKAWQRLSHAYKEATAETIVKDCDEVRHSIAPLAEAGLLGALLIQFPWSFRHTPENVEHMERLFRRLEEFSIAVEVRHGSWNLESFYALLREKRVTFCNVDQPVIGNSMNATGAVTARVGYLRLHGRNYGKWFAEDAGRDARYDYLYSREEIGEIALLIRNLRQSAAETYAITNNHFMGQAVSNALDLLEELDGRAPAVPPTLATAYPHLARRP